MKHLIRNILSVFLLFAVFGPAKAQLLWEIEGDNLKEKSYLFGTMHTADPRVFDFDPETLAAFEASEGMAGELVFDGNLSAGFLEMMMMPGDTSLADLLSEEEYATVMKKLEAKVGFFCPNIQPSPADFHDGSAFRDRNGEEKTGKQGQKSDRPSTGFVFAKQSPARRQRGHRFGNDGGANGDFQQHFFGCSGENVV